MLWTVPIRDDWETSGKYFEEAASTICVDHHISNQGFGDLTFVIPDASSTCEILYDIFEEKKMSFDTAQCLYLGIVHDTGVFKHSNTTRRVMEIAGALIEKGVRRTLSSMRHFIRRRIFRTRFSAAR